MIKLENVCKSYRVNDKDVPILQNISLDIAVGEFVAITGASGSGKSTLMNIIGFLTSVSTGNYFFDSIDINKATDGQLAQLRNRHIGFVFQHFHLLAKLTALQNVELALVYAGVKKKIREEKARLLLENVGLGDRINYLPNQLSGGEKQRVAIARALANDPTFILADEPTGALDSVTSKLVMELFLQMNALGKTVVVITHDLNVANYAKRNIVMCDGQISSSSEEIV